MALTSRLFGRHPRRKVPYGMFDRESYGLAAKEARVLERIYHKGHALAWDGKEVLEALVAEHGEPSLDAKEREALGRVFAVILWGELAAWRISAELADELDAFEAKMAATSQAFDEARHFYVMHDYLERLGAMPDGLDFGAEKLLEGVMNADNLAKKLLGMQLMVEPIALTLFQLVKRLDLEPVLSGLMPYYEKDEARHVALGVKYLPALLSKMSVAERVELWAFQAKLLTYEMMSSRSIARDLETLGLEARTLLHVGKGKQLQAMQMVFESLGLAGGVPARVMEGYADVLGELFIPDSTASFAQRLWRARDIMLGREDYSDVELDPEVLDDETPLIKGAGAASGGPRAAA